MSENSPSHEPTEPAEFQAAFWGVRGSIPCPGPATVRYGGETSCIELRCGRNTVILDAGSGLRRLGDRLVIEDGLDADILLSHTHYDHVCGLPFFEPFYSDKNTIRLWAGHLEPPQTLEHVLCEMEMGPLRHTRGRPIGAQVSFNDYMSGQSFTLKNGIRVHTTPLNHPNEATGYRIEFAGRSLCYVTDTEHTVGRLDVNIVELIRDADILIYDSDYTDQEYPRFRGWGHSTWQAGAELADAANIRTFVIFHHDPSHDDAFMDRVALAAKKRRPGTIVAYEGIVIDLTNPKVSGV
ncbi:MAG: MBL fold metallo-hydrolase [Alphaproteobacteria bacterium]